MTRNTVYHSWIRFSSLLVFDFELSRFISASEFILAVTMMKSRVRTTHLLEVLTMNDLIQLLPWQHIARKLGKPCGIVFVSVTHLGENTSARTHFFIVFSNDTMSTCVHVVAGTFSGSPSLSL